MIMLVNREQRPTSHSSHCISVKGLLTLTGCTQMALLEEAGIEYDHSLMHHDCQMYWAPHAPENIVETNYKSAQASDWMKPMSVLRPSSIVEIPASWHLDDWPAFQPKPALGSAGFVDPHHVERFWKEHFTYCYDNYDTFVFPISIHPQVSGKPQILMMHDRLIQWINSHQGVEWCTFGEMADRFRRGEFPGVTVEGGAEV